MSLEIETKFTSKQSKDQMSAELELSYQDFTQEAKGGASFNKSSSKSRTNESTMIKARYSGTDKSGKQDCITLQDRKQAMRQI